MWRLSHATEDKLRAGVGRRLEVDDCMRRSFERLQRDGTPTSGSPGSWTPCSVATTR